MVKTKTSSIKRKKGATLSRERYSDLAALFILKLRALYDIEDQLTKSMVAMAKAANDNNLRASLLEHLTETDMHVQRLEVAFETLGILPKVTKVEGVRGLIKDVQWLMKNVPSGPARDASMISSALEIENYEIAAYGTALEWATMLGYEDIKDLLEQTCVEEEGAADKLMTLGVEKVFPKAGGRKITGSGDL